MDCEDIAQGALHCLPSSALGLGAPGPVMLWAGGLKAVMDAAEAPRSPPRQQAQQAPGPSGEGVVRWGQVSTKASR